MTWTFLTQSGPTSGTGTAAVKAGPLNTAGANLIVVSVVDYDGFAVGTLTDTLTGNTYTPIQPPNYDNTPNAFRAQLFYCVPVASGASVSWTYTMSGAGGAAVIVALFKSNWGQPGLDQQLANNSATSTVTLLDFAGSNLTPVQSNELIVTVLGLDTAASALAVSIGTVVNTTTFNSGVLYGSAASYYFQGAATGVNPQWTWTGASHAILVGASFTQPSIPGSLAMMGVGSWAAQKLEQNPVLTRRRLLLPASRRVHRA